jgi:phage terminase large subunit-like protein
LCSLPVGAVSRAPGDAAIRLAASAGLILDEWQQLVLRESLGVRADGKWAAFSSCVIVPRQNGKGAILEALALAGLFLFECELIVWTAHEMKTAKEGFRRLVSHITGTPDLKRKVAKIKHGNDDRGIELKDGRRIQFLARSSGSGRGFTGDLVILDESYELDADVMAALLPTLSAVPNPQIWYTSSAPMAKSEQLHAVRKRAIAGGQPRLAFFEWSAAPDADPRSEEAWAQANPSYPHRVDNEAIESEWGEFNADVDPSKFWRERLGRPDEPEGDADRPIPIETWNTLADDASLGTDSTLRLALDAPPDRRSATFAVAGVRTDNLLHVQIRLHCHPTQNGDQSLKDRVVEAALQLCEGHKVSLILPPSSPARAWKADLIAAGVPLDEMVPAEYAEACGRITDAVNDGTLRHRNQPEMNAAVAGLAARVAGDVEAWSRRNSSANIAPFVAATCALVRVPVPKLAGGLFLAVT